MNPALAGFFVFSLYLWRMLEVTIRDAVREDVPEMLSLIQELADYERASDEVWITREELERDGFGNNPLYWALIAEHEGAIAGMAFYYIRYSTWKGRSLYLEDLVVKEAYRRKGFGKQLFEAVLVRAREIGASQVNWQVLDWNDPAIEFYRKYKAEFDDEWINCKLTVKRD